MEQLGAHPRAVGRDEPTESGHGQIRAKLGDESRDMAPAAPIAADACRFKD
jgi:hypothetical protein